MPDDYASARSRHRRTRPFSLPEDYPLSKAASVLRQDEPQLRATVEALGTRVAEQDDRISQLENDLSAIRTVVAGLAQVSAPGDSTPVVAAPNGSYTIVGSMSLEAESSLDPVVKEELDNNFFWTVIDGERTCIGSGGFDDLGGRMEVVVSDGAGNTLAVGEAGSGIYQPSRNACVFQFSVDVPRAEFYAIRVGQREGPTYTFEDLEADNWEVALSIG